MNNMKILVMSDSHGRRDLVEDCVRRHTEAEVVIHLGDVLTDVEYLVPQFPEKQFYFVHGNCDWRTDYPAAQCVEIGGVRVFFAHGHRLAVKYGLTTFMAVARQNEAHICLYGHTHEPYNKYHDGLYVMNPGSLAEPRGTSRPSYGLIDIVPQGIVTNIVETDRSIRRF